MGLVSRMGAIMKAFRAEFLGLATLPAIVLLIAVRDVDAHEPAARLEVSERFQELVTELVRGTIPHNYVNEKDWGKTKEVVRGLYIKREGLRIKTHRTRKPVNHGTWKRHRIDLLDPAQSFHVQLQRIRSLPQGGVAFDIICDAKLRVSGRVSQWQQGVQLASLSAEADAAVRLTMQCEMMARIDATHTIPDLELDPVVRSAALYIKSFRLREISRLDGPLIKALSASVREVLEDEVEKRRDKLVQKINRQIDKNQDSLRMSFNELLTASEKSK